MVPTVSLGRRWMVSVKGWKGVCVGISGLGSYETLPAKVKDPAEGFVVFWVEPARRES